MNSFLVNNTYLLKKFPEKGGWTYASIPKVLQDKTVPFGWVKDEPLAHKRFLALSESKQKEIIDWISQAKKEEMKIERISSCIDKLLK